MDLFGRNDGRRFRSHVGCQTLRMDLFGLGDGRRFRLHVGCQPLRQGIRHSSQCKLRFGFHNFLMEFIVFLYRNARWLALTGAWQLRLGRRRHVVLPISQRLNYRAWKFRVRLLGRSRT